MTMTAFTFEVAELCIEEGERRERGYNARLVTPSPDMPEARKGTLAVLLDLVGPTAYRRRYLRQLLTTIQQAYYSTPGTILSSLVYALRQAHQELLNINEGLPEEERYTCHAACLVTHSDELYLAQVGATTVAVLLPDGLQWFSPLLYEEEEPVPLGVPRDVRPHTARLHVPPDTMVLVLDSSWVGQIDEDRFREAIALPQPQEVLETLAETVSVSTLSALALKVVPAKPAETLGSPVTETAAAVEAVEPEVEVLEEAGEEGEGPSWRERLTNLVRRLLPERRGPAEELLPEMPSPPSLEMPERVPVQPRKVTVPGWRRRLWWAIVVLPLVFILGAVAYSWQQARAREAQYQSLITAARSALAQAQQVQDPQVVREQLRQAEEALQQAKLLRPDDPVLAQIQLQIDERRRNIERVQALPLMWPLASVEGMHVSRVLVAGQDIYLLDQASDTVYRYTLRESGEQVVNETPERILGRGDTIEGRQVGDLVDITWLPAGPVTPRGGVAALDGAGLLFFYDSLRGASVLPLSRPDAWRSPARVLVYVHRLYVLDPGANTIFRFLPGEGGYTLPPETYFTVPVDLAGVQDFAIDGNVYLLYPDGRLLRFFQGAQKDFTVETALTAPIALTTTDMLPYLFVADPGGRRVLVFDKEQGNLVAQLVPGQGIDADFGNLQAFFVPEDMRSIVLVAGSTLWRAPLSLP